MTSMLGLRSRKETEEIVDINIPIRTVVRVMLVVLAALIGLTLIRQASHALTLIFVAFFLSLALNGPVQWIAKRLPGKRKGSRATATGISFMIVLVLLVAFIVSIVPPLIRQTSNFINSAPQQIQDIRSGEGDIGRFVKKYKLEDDIDKFSSQLSDRLKDASGTAVSTFTTATSSFFAILTVLVLTFMMLVEGPRWLRFFRDIIPERQHKRADRLATDMYKVVKGYVNGQVLLALIASAMLLPALLILGVPYPAALVVVVFICGLIPLVGHTIGAIIVTTVALFHSPWSAIIVLAYYILYQQIENYVIQPRVQANTTNMSPLLVFMSVIVGVSFGGLLGGLVAIPVAGCIRIALIDYLQSKQIIEPRTATAALKTDKS